MWYVDPSLIAKNDDLGMTFTYPMHLSISRCWWHYVSYSCFQWRKRRNNLYLTTVYCSADMYIPTTLQRTGLSAIAP